ncbi:MAG: glycosyltransferase 87 family protein [Flavobacteriales bacterium]
MQNRIFIVSGAVISTLIYIFLNHWTERHEFGILFGGMCILFALYFCSALIPTLRPGRRDVFWLSLIFRGVLIFSIPFLSDDFYRFYLDGTLTLNGTDPFAFKPNELDFSLIPDGNYLQQEIYPKLNSQEYYSVYPAFLQYVFALGALIGGTVEGFCLTMKAFLLVNDFFLLAVLYRITSTVQIKSQRAALFMLNPLVIMETANLHLESMVVLFIALAWLFFMERKNTISGVMTGIAFQIKLLPILILPFLVKNTSLKNILWVGLGFVIGTTLLIFPFLSTHLWPHFSQSLSLYFKTFEFNGGLYLLLREIGFLIKGYNTIDIIGSVTPVLFLIVLYAIWSKSSLKNFPTALLFVFTAYYFLASIVHPWYLIPVLFFATFTKYRFAWMWSFLIYLSYSSYHRSGTTEEYWLIASEYLIVWGYLAYELFFQKQTTGTIAS